MIYDAIVVGLGPGGSTAARTLTANGMRVLALEKEYMPRYKPCGGAVSARVQQVFKEDISSVLEDTIYGGAFSFRGAEHFSARFPKPVVYMVMRPQFDQLLCQYAEDHGADIRQGERVRAIHTDAEMVSVTTSQGVYRAAWLIGADGASGLVRRHVTQDYRGSPIAGLEAEISPAPQIVQQYTEEVTLDFGALPNGYSWVFPKRNHLSVGTAGAFRQVAQPRHLYSRFLTHQGLENWTDEKVHGHIIPIYLGGRPRVQQRRILLVGDAARLVDPFMGEGIYYAIKSAHIASHAILDSHKTALSAGDLYDQRLRQDVLTELKTALKVARLLYCFPHYGYHLFKTHAVLVDSYFKVLCGDHSVTDFYRSLRRAAWGSLLRTGWWLRDVHYRAPVVIGHKLSMPQR